MAKFLGVLMAALLAWSLAAADALAAEGRWQQVENKANCAVWNPAPQPNEAVTWDGACANGKGQGRGVLVWRYVQDGEWKEEIYTGEMKDGKQHGRGVTVTAAGDRYDGDFRDGNINGRGVFMLANGDRYDGEFSDGIRNGRGVYLWANGDRYDGYWRVGKQHGRGVFVLLNGDRYDGDWRRGMKHGRGVYVYANGDRYDGDFLDDKPNGSGAAIISGRTYSGYWNNGCFKSMYGSWANMFSTKEDCGF